MDKVGARSGASAALSQKAFDGPRTRKIIRRKVVEERVGVGRTTIWRKSNDPDDDFPVPVQLIGNLIGWYEDEVDAWIANRPRVCWAPAKENDAADNGTGQDHSLPDEAT